MSKVKITPAAAGAAKDLSDAGKAGDAPLRTAGLGTRIQADIHKRMKMYALENGMSLAELIERSALAYMDKNP